MSREIELAAGDGHRAGTVAIVGRPNVGKSTLLNAIMGVKLAIVTPRPQTTRNRIAGIKSTADAQMVFLDTPGIHDPRHGVLSRRLVDIARTALREADVVLLLIDSLTGVGRDERGIAETMTASGRPGVVALNKMDRIARLRLLPLMDTVHGLLPTSDIVPVSALTGENLDNLLRVIRGLLPIGPPLYGENEITDQTERFIAQEVVREKVFELTRDEIPYASAVITEEFIERPARLEGPAVLYIRALVLTSRPTQKAIIIGKGGALLKEIGSRARRDLEQFFTRRVFLELHVKVEEGWETNRAVLEDVGL